MSSLKVNTVLSADTPTVNITDGLHVTGICTVTEVNVGTAATIHANGNATFSGIATATTVNTTNLINATPLSHRNIIINGAMCIAQRATSSTTSGYGDVDRWQHEYTSTDEAPTFAQVSLTTSDTPYTLGLTKAFKITNGNQTSGLQVGSQINFMQPIEAQNIRNSGWDYKSSSNYITLSYWVRASVAQEYHGFVKTADGSNYVYPFSLGSLSANTWTKITKTIPGNSNLQIDDDNGAGFQVWPVAFYGTNYTNDSITENAWAAWASGNRSTDQTSTWWTTNDSTFEVTGVQLEVGSVATPFEHRSYADELVRCYRYYQLIVKGSEGTSGARSPLVSGSMWGGGQFYGALNLKTRMRAIPSLDAVNGTDYWQVYNNTTDTCDTLAYNNASPDTISLYLSGNLSGTAYVGGWSRTNNAAAFAAVKAEL